MPRDRRRSTVPNVPDPFVETLIAARRNSLVVAALAILAEPWVDPCPGSPLRGVAYAYNAQDDDMGYHRANALAGEFEAR